MFRKEIGGREEKRLNTYYLKVISKKEKIGKRGQSPSAVPMEELQRGKMRVV